MYRYVVAWTRKCVTSLRLTDAGCTIHTELRSIASHKKFGRRRRRLPTARINCNVQCARGHRFHFNCRRYTCHVRALQPFVWHLNRQQFSIFYFHIRKYHVFPPFIVRFVLPILKQQFSIEWMTCLLPVQPPYVRRTSTLAQREVEREKKKIKNKLSIHCENIPWIDIDFSRCEQFQKLATSIMELFALFIRIFFCLFVSGTMTVCCMYVWNGWCAQLSHFLNRRQTKQNMSIMSVDE